LLGSDTLKLRLREAFQAKIEGTESVWQEGRLSVNCTPPFYEEFLDGVGGSLEGTEYAHRALAPGGFYEDCAYHPCLAMGVDAEQDDIWGISLVDGSWPRSCSLNNCGVIPLTVEQVWRWKLQGPDETVSELPEDRSWWTAESAAYYEQTRSEAGREMSETQFLEWRQSTAGKDDPTA